MFCFTNQVRQQKKMWINPSCQTSVNQDGAKRRGKKTNMSWEWRLRRDAASQGFFCLPWQTATLCQNHKLSSLFSPTPPERLPRRKPYLLHICIIFVFFSFCGDERERGSTEAEPKKKKNRKPTPRIDLKRGLSQCKCIRTGVSCVVLLSDESVADRLRLFIYILAGTTLLHHSHFLFCSPVLLHYREHLHILDITSSSAGWFEENMFSWQIMQLWLNLCE